MASRCHALVLAAGTGTRMGGPKALLEHDGLPLLLVHMERALGLGVEKVSAIVRPEVAELLAPRLVGRPDHLHLVAARTDSQASSLALLLRELMSTAQLAGDLTFLITPVDVLPCTQSTYQALSRALDPRTSAATPTFGGRGGHPVLVRSELLGPYLEGPLDTRPPLRDVLHQAGPRRKRVEVAEATTLSDLDTREQAERYRLKAPW